jgi:hypothetical protein
MQQSASAAISAGATPSHRFFDPCGIMVRIGILAARVLLTNDTGKSCFRLPEID